MGKCLHVGAAACGAVACVLLIVAMASSAWMTGCLLYDNMFAAVKQLDVDLPENYEQGAQLLSGQKLCIHLGLFKITMKAANLVDLSMGIDILNTPKAVLFGIFAMVFSVVVGAIGVIFLIVAVGGGSSSYEAKSAVASRTRAGMILLVLAGIAVVFGMASYTGGTANAVGNPMMFMAQMGVAAGPSFQEKLTGFPSGRRKRDLSLYGLDPSLESYIAKMTEGLDPGYGYAYALGWVSLVFAIIAAALAALAKQRLIDQPYSGPSNVKL